MSQFVILGSAAVAEHESTLRMNIKYSKNPALLKRQQGLNDSLVHLGTQILPRKESEERSTLCHSLSLLCFTWQSAFFDPYLNKRALIILLQDFCGL